MKILLVVYDNDSHISFFPLGTAYIASACRNAGHEVEIYSQDVYHWPESHLTDLLDKKRFDAVGIGTIGGYYQYRKLLKISVAINSSRQRPFFVLGGHGPSPEPEYFLKKTGADAVVLGEGEETIKELLNALENKGNLAEVKGLAFTDSAEKKFVITSERELAKNISDAPLPAWDLFPMEHYVLRRFANTAGSDRSMCLISGRGCSFRCNFCYRMEKGLRIREPESIIEEIKLLKERYAVNYLFFADELLMNSENRVESLCNAFLKEKLNVKWNCEGRLNYAKLPLLKLMKKAGCVFINYGIESMDDKALKTMRKALTVKQIIEGIENTLAAGISPGLNIIFGNIGETADILKKDVGFLLKYDDHAQMRTIRPVTPYPGSPLYYYAIEKGMLEGPEDFYERKHVNSDLISVNFTNMPDNEVHRLLFEANRILIRKYHSDQQKKIIETARKLYLDGNVSFRGFRPV